MEPTTAGTWATNRAEWNALIGRYLPQLKRFAQTHLPAHLRGTITADDLVQEVVLSGIRQLHRLEFRHEHAFLSLLADINPPSYRGRDQKDTASAGSRAAVDEIGMSIRACHRSNGSSRERI